MGSPACNKEAEMISIISASFFGGRLESETKAVLRAGVSRDYWPRCAAALFKVYRVPRMETKSELII